MKPSTLTAMALCLAMKGFAQSAPPNQSLTSTEFVSAIQATTSQGYLYWKEVPNAVYKVNLYKKMGSNFIFTTAFNSEKNYLKLSSDVLARKNMYYELIAIHQLNGNKLLIGEKTPIENKYKSGENGSGDNGGADGNGANLMCVKKCNGPDYAYQLSLYTNPIANQNFMTMESTNDSTYQITNPTGVVDYVIPYYEAIKIGDWNALPASHPYKEFNPSTGVPKYKKIPLPLGYQGNGLMRKDKNDMYVNTGMLVEKKTNKYSHMEGIDANASPNLNYCTSPMYAWLGFYNSYTGPNDFAPASIASFMGYNVTNTTDLECKAFVPNLPHVELGSIDYVNFNTFSDCIFNNVWNSEGWLHCFEVFGVSPYVITDKPYTVDDLIKPITDKPIETKPRITAIDVSPISSLDEDAANFQLVIDEKGANYHYRSQGLKNGLYNVAFIFSNGTVIPIVNELNFPDKIVSNNEKVEVKISPNKIENNLINLDLNALDNVRFKLEIIDLAGALIHSEQIDMKKAEQMNKKIAVSTANVAYNQLRLNLIFSDGSNIQQTILK